MRSFLTIEDRDGRQLVGVSDEAALHMDPKTGVFAFRFGDGYVLRYTVLPSISERMGAYAAQAAPDLALVDS